MLSYAKKAAISAHIYLSRDAKDDHYSYLSTSKEVKGDFLITEDKHLLTPPEEILKKNNLSCQIITLQELLEL